MRSSIIIQVLLVILPIPVLAHDYYVEASRTAIVREEADKNSDLLLRLERGEQLNTVTSSQTNRFYNVFLPNGEPGWVSRYVVRLYEGNAPDAPPPALMPNVGGGLTTSEQEWAGFHLAIGKPNGYKELIREGYVVGYDPQLKIPVWVQYRLTRAKSANNIFPRTDSFAADGAVSYHARATLPDYEGFDGAYVRGHMAPAEDMRWSESAEDESNLLTNIAPQVGSSYNGSIWKTIENHVRGWVIDREDLTIICGPIFEARDQVHAIERQPETERQKIFNVIGENNVAVPTAFFKIVIDMRDMQNPNVLPFLVHHIVTVPGPERKIGNYLTSVDSIETLTGLDFLTYLSDATQEEIESFVPSAVW